MGLHVGQFNDSFKPIMDGVGVCMENYARWIHRNHGRATVVAPEAPGYADACEYEVLRFFAAPLPHMKPFRAGLPWLDPAFMHRFRRARFDLVHAHCPFVSGKLARGVSRRRRIPMVATFHSKYRDDFLTVTGSPTLARLGLRYVVGFYEAATEVWTPNRATARTLQSYGFRGSVEVVPNGTDLEPPTAAEHAALAARGRRHLGLSAADGSLPVYLFVGQHRWEKNVELIIHTLSVLHRRGHDFRMVFAGTGYAERAMQRMCRAEGIAEKVSFLGLILERERLKELYATATVLLFPSLYDNSPLVMREAAGFGVPTVLIRGASAAEGVTAGENGFLTDNDPGALAALLARCAEDPRLAQRVGEGARRDIYLHWRDVVADVYRRYEVIVKRSRRSSVRVDQGIGT